MDFNQYLTIGATIIAILIGIIDLLIKWKQGKTILGEKRIIVYSIIFLIIGFCSGYFYGRNQEYKIKQPYVEKNNHLYTYINHLRSYIDNIHSYIKLFNNEIGEVIIQRKFHNYAVVYTETNFEGNRLILFPKESYSNLHQYGFGDKIQSIKIIGNVKLYFYQDADFQKYLNTISTSVSDLRKSSNKISSIKFDN
ncbi:MAG: hypothetical protein EPN82_13105 [Bacteroidetes bacterium]|nr:MAG: hypothetical protein EPN82_13105 [Bacteroidota bacterium]